MSPSIILGLLRVVKTEMTNWPHGNGLNKGSSINDIMHLGGGERGEERVSQICEDLGGWGVFKNVISQHQNAQNLKTLKHNL